MKSSFKIYLIVNANEDFNDILLKYILNKMSLKYSFNHAKLLSKDIIIYTNYRPLKSLITVGGNGLHIKNIIFRPLYLVYEILLLLALCQNPLHSQPKM